MIVMCAVVKRFQVCAIGKDKKVSGILTVERVEKNEQNGRVRDQVHDFFVDSNLDGQVKAGDEVNIEVRPWVPEGDRSIKFEFVRFLGKSGKA